MDNYKILLTGRHRATIDRFFAQTDSDTTCLTSSMRRADLNNHLNMIRPDALIYCMSEETSEDMAVIKDYRSTFLRSGINLVVIGEGGDITSFQKETGNMASLTIKLPLNINDAKGKIKQLIDDKAKERRALEEQLGLVPEVKQADAEDASGTEEAKAVRKKILVVDDDAMVLKLIKGYLGDRYDIASAISGKIAYKYLESKSVDLILLDYEMPDEQGPDVFVHIRNMDSESKDAPVVFLTGVTERAKLVKALTLKPSGYVPKPIDAQKLNDVVVKLIGE